MSRAAERAVSPATLRKRRQRAREAAVREVAFTRADWAAYLNPDRLPQKAGSPPDRLRAMILKELADNALDAGATASLAQVDPDTWIVADDGPGLDREQVLRLFAVNRPMISTKLLRRPTRGALGNGLRVVTGGTLASRGTLTVESRGARYVLDVDRETGETLAVEEGESGVDSGTRVTVAFGPALRAGDDDGWMAMSAIGCFGPAAEPMLSHPRWYDRVAFAELVEAAEPGTTVADIAALMGVDLDDPRPATEADLHALTRHAGPQPSLVALGAKHFPGIYASVLREPGEYQPVPALVEAWVTAARCPTEDRCGAVTLLVNRSPVAAPVSVLPYRGKRLLAWGCNLARTIERVPAGMYSIRLAVTSPVIPITTEGKEPDLRPLWGVIEPALAKAMRKAHAAVSSGARKGDIKAAARATMVEAYERTAGSRNRANARQIMYVGRRLMGEILQEGTVIDDDYFTQHLLPDFVEEHPELTAHWNVDYDNRGHLTEPHTGVVIDCGSESMEDYLGPSRRRSNALVSVDRSLHPTKGPKNRFGTLLFIEKEGFGGLLAEAKIRERFDCAVISTKGMSVISARRAIDRFGQDGVHVLVAHDFDRAGAYIAYTLGHTTRRYKFAVEPKIVDIGLSLAEARAMGLDDEAAPDSGPKAAKLRTYGLSEEEIDFLVGQRRRYELNAMTSDQFVAWVEDNLTRHGAGKVIPPAEVLAEHARVLLARKAAEGELARVIEKATAEAARATLPDDLEGRVRSLLEVRPELCWEDGEEIVLADVTLGAA